MHAEFDYTIDT